MQRPDRDAPEADWLVYGDALQQTGDPRGELIALDAAVLRGMAPADRDAYVAHRADQLLGKAAKHRAAYTFTWRYLADRVAIRVDDDGEAVGRILDLFASPLGEALHAVELVGAATGARRMDLRRAVDALVRHLPASVRELALVDERASRTKMLSSRDYTPPDNLVDFGPLDRVFQVPGLEALRLVVADTEQLDVTAIDAPALRAFTLHGLRYGSGDPNPLSDKLAAAKWPQLRSFALRLAEEYAANIVDDADSYLPTYAGDDNFDERADEAEAGESYNLCDWEQLWPLLENLATVPLERLALTSFFSVDSLLATLVQSGLPRTLVELDLSDSSIASADWFVQHRALIEPLQRLVVEGTRLAPADLARLRALGPEVVHSHGGGASYRYVVGSE